MKVEVTTLTRRGGTPIRRSRTVEAERLRFGRAPDSEVRLEDLRIELQAGTGIETLCSVPARIGRATIEDNSSIETHNQKIVGHSDKAKRSTFGRNNVSLVMHDPHLGLDAAA